MPESDQRLGEHSEVSVDYQRYSRFLIRRDGRILRVSLNRPEALNAIDGQTHLELTTIFRDIQEDAEADVVILTGEGKAFSAGGDVDWLSDLVRRGISPDMGHVKQIVYSLLELEKPVIARVPGVCVGLGATIALFSDIIIASENARFGDPHVKVGAVAGDGGAVIWPQLVGFARAKQYLLTGDIMTAQEAERIGLITKVVPRDKLDEEVQRIALQLVNGATQAIRWTKLAINMGLHQLAHSIMESCVPNEILSMKLDDHVEALDAFREKRTPRFALKQTN
ncbi:MAG: enoyl-CoA hydratase/isomerase family protein [Alphaproteobacteria bacterium]|nr:enoyl-CoA hydratase/isomerase family protein [Alphaproteobacteria bacterium]